MSRDAERAPEPSIAPLGETALLLGFGDSIDDALNERVLRAAASLAIARLPGVIDVVPAYASLALHYDPAIWSRENAAPWRELAAAVRAVLEEPAIDLDAAFASVEIPVCYGGEHGPDLDEVARHAGLDANEVARRHATGRYRVAMLGFAPGFPYLLGLDERLATPRRDHPRTRVPAGSVAIGGRQTGIYPNASPGGWQLIGRTPVALFDAMRDPPSLLAPGDRVRFLAIGAREFAERARAGR